MTKNISIYRHILFNLINIALFVTILGGIISVYILFEYSRDLPDYRQLSDYKPRVTTRLYAGDGSLLAEYANQRRLFVPIDKIPERIKQAFISAEDKRFYSHIGIDFIGILRASFANIHNLASGRRLEGASTITQQVTKNVLLTSERTLKRKIKEAILALRMERTFDKNHILELYLNEIYLGSRAYGVAAAALQYFNKTLDELSLSEAAFLASLPKAPNRYNPNKNYDTVIERRNWILNRMAEDSYISFEEATSASEDKIVLAPLIDEELSSSSDYFSEEVRKEISEKYGREALYEGGLAIRTTLDPNLQKIATSALKSGLLAYDKRHGWRGPITNLENPENIPFKIENKAKVSITNINKPNEEETKDKENNKTIKEKFQDYPIPAAALKDWKLGLVKTVAPNEAKIELQDKSEGVIPLNNLKWARKCLPEQRVGKEVTSANEVLTPNDIILVSLLDNGTYELEQIPNVSGALVALDPHTGRVLSIVGGFSFDLSQYNRATQAYRQPGSSFKPFVYLAAFDNGYSPADLILDSAFVLDQGGGIPVWKPNNYSKSFQNKPIPLRIGVEQSKNAMTVRLAQALGMPIIQDYAAKFGIIKDMPPYLTMSLGAGETRLLDLTAAYGMLVNGGKKITPTLIDRIQDRDGKSTYKHDNRTCETCQNLEWDGSNPPQIPDLREQITNPQSAYQIVSLLQGVVERGTAKKLKKEGLTLAGKTGTTNNYNDAWFIGFTPDLVAGVYVGFDQPKTLGRGETGSTAAAPIFKMFIDEAIKEKADIPFRIPSGIKLVRINKFTGKPASTADADEDVITESFKSEDKVGENKIITDLNYDSVKREVSNEEENGLELGSEY